MYKPSTGRQDSMAVEESSPFSLALPPEIWSIVLHSFGTQPQDLVELWVGCRGVSNFFKHEVEGIFIADYLPHISLRFDISTSLGFRDHQVQAAYNRTSADRTRAFFQAQDQVEEWFLKHVGNASGFSWPSHLVDLSRPFRDVALPEMFFHANGNVEVGWRELFAAVLAEEKSYYRTSGAPANFGVCRLPLKAFTYDQTQAIEEHASRTVTERRMGAPMLEQGFREAEILEANMSKATQANAPLAQVFHMVIIPLWNRAQV